MRTLRVAFEHFWPRFEPEHLLRGLPMLARELRFEPVGRRPELRFASCFLEGRRQSAPPPPTRDAPVVFFTAENVRPDFSTCDFALSFRRDLDDERHLRLPNHVFAAHVAGFPTDALVRRASRDPARIRRSKRRFCSFLQANPIALRERFVELLDARKAVDCGGARRNTLGRIVPRAEKHAWLAEAKFTVAFENEAEPGYVTEKLGDALLADTVPLYWGAPDVALDFEPGCFLHLRDFDDLERFVEEVLAVDADDARYEALLAAPAYRENRLPAHADPEAILAFFRRVAAEARPRPHALGGVHAPVHAPVSTIGSTIGSTPPAAPRPARALSPAPAGFHGDRHLQRVVDWLAPQAELYLETGANVGSSLGWIARRHPHLACLACEPDPEAVRVARAFACTRPGVELFAETSQEFLGRLAREHALALERPTLAWLDAHGHGFEWPLVEELRFLSGTLASAFLLIDDFEVPGDPRFGFDAYDGLVCGLELVRPALAPGRALELYLPAYAEHTSAWHPLRGFALIVLGPAPRPRPDLALPGLVRAHDLRGPRARAAEQAFRAGELARAERLLLAELTEPTAHAHARCWSDLGVVLHAAGRPDEALEAFGRALALDPAQEDALANLAALLAPSARPS